MQAAKHKPDRLSSCRRLRTWLLDEGRTLKFGITASSNVLLSNGILQLLLLVPTLPVWLCTLTSQLCNGFLGYAAYGKLVFGSRSLRSFNLQLRYATLQISLWVLNWLLTQGCMHLIGNRNLSALAPIPLLAIVSYSTQRMWIFHKS